LLYQQSVLQRLLIYVLMCWYSIWFRRGTATGGIYSGTGVTDDGNEKLIPLILLRLGTHTITYTLEILTIVRTLLVMI
jgi:hypothetical protein